MLMQVNLTKNILDAVVSPQHDSDQSSSHFSPRLQRQQVSFSTARVTLCGQQQNCPSAQKLSHLWLGFTFHVNIS